MEKDMENKTIVQPGPPMYAHDCTYRIVSLVAYLIGVPKKFFEDGSGNLQGDVYLSLEKDKNARIIRNLCRLRTAIERNFKSTNSKMKYEYKTLYGMPGLVSVECINQLEADGVFVMRNSSVKLYQHIIVINRLISERVNNCRGIFPLWINWDYVKDRAGEAGKIPGGHPAHRRGLPGALPEPCGFLHIASSDSDYWGLISSLPDADFLLLVEREKCGYSMKNALTSSHIFYCYMDDFYTGDGSEIQTSALIKAVHHYLDSLFQLNVNDMMEEVYRVTRVNMSEAEKRQFYEKYVKPMHLVIDKSGNVTIELKK